jgi:hypothetical protein
LALHLECDRSVYRLAAVSADQREQDAEDTQTGSSDQDAVPSASNRQPIRVELSRMLVTE